MASTGSNSSVQDADVRDRSRRHRRRADELQRRPDDRRRRRRRARTVWRGPSVRAPRDSCSPTPDPRTARAKRPARQRRSCALVEVEYPAPAPLATLPYHGLARPRGGAAGHSADGAAPRRARPAPSSMRAVGTVDPGVDRTAHRARADRRIRLRLAVLTSATSNEGAITKGDRVSDVQGAVRRAAAPARGQRVRLLRRVWRRTSWNRTSGTSSRPPVGIDLWLAAAAAVGEFRTVRGDARRARTDVARRAGRSEHDAGAGRGRALRGPGASRRCLAARQGVVADPDRRHRSRDGPRPPPLNVDGLMDSFRLGTGSCARSGRGCFRPGRSSSCAS